MIDGPQLLTDPVRKPGPLTYLCSKCGREFLLSEKISRGEAITELWARFNEHAAKAHGEGRTAWHRQDAATGQSHIAAITGTDQET